MKFPEKKCPKEKYLSVDVHVSIKEVKTRGGWGKCLIPGPVTPMGLAICKGSCDDKANIGDRGFGVPAESAGIGALVTAEEHCLYTVKTVTMTRYTSTCAAQESHTSNGRRWGFYASSGMYADDRQYLQQEGCSDWFIIPGRAFSAICSWFSYSAKHPSGALVHAQGEISAPIFQIAT